jgi:hypothetical protein
MSVAPGRLLRKEGRKNGKNDGQREGGREGGMNKEGKQGLVGCVTCSAQQTANHRKKLKLCLKKKKLYFMDLLR